MLRGEFMIDDRSALIISPLAALVLLALLIIGVSTPATAAGAQAAPFPTGFVVDAGNAGAMDSLDDSPRFDLSSVWHGFFCINGEVCQVGDFNGDGRDDIVAFVRDTQQGDGQGDVRVALSNGLGFDLSSVWHDFFCISDEVCRVGDFNGDGKDDIAAFVRDTQRADGQGDVWVALSSGQRFFRSSVWHDFFCITDETCQIGDFNGDGKDDIAAFVRDTQREDRRGDVWVALSNGEWFFHSAVWHDFFCISDETCQVGDYNGDGRDDIAAFVRDTQPEDGRGNVWVALADGLGFFHSSVWHDFFCISDETCQVGDFNGDGKDDIAAFVRDTQEGDGQGDVWVALSHGQWFFPSAVWHDFFCISDEVCQVGDFNGDGKDDIAAFVRDTQEGDGQGDVWVALSGSTTIGDEGPDLSLTMSDSPDPVLAGNDLTYTLTATNEATGARVATGVFVVDTLPPGVTFKSTIPSQSATQPLTGNTVVWDVGDLLGGQSETMDIVVTVGPATPDGTVLSNTAVIQGDQPDPPENNTVTEDTTVNQASGFDCSVVNSISTQECGALVSLYHSTGGPNWTENTGWLVSADPCGWTGIECSGDQIMGISLDGQDGAGNGLTGSIPGELGNLDALLRLALSGNQLGGSIPPGLVNLSLERFEFDNTQLCEPSDQAFQAWLATIADLRSTGVVCHSSATAEPSLSSLQDSSDGATGLKVNIPRVFDLITGDDRNLGLESFQAELTYRDASANPVFPAGTRCLNILEVREMDFPITDRDIDHASGITTIDGSDATGVPWPADLGHALTRLNGSAGQLCSIHLEFNSLGDGDGGLLTVPPILTRLVQRGDARADENVTTADALFIAQHLVGARGACTSVETTSCLLSVNGASVRQDGAFDRINVADARFIAQYLLGIRDEFYNLSP
jgi:uncharacterized repeat protein (TIGR01451 family)